MCTKPYLVAARRAADRIGSANRSARPTRPASAEATVPAARTQNATSPKYDNPPMKSAMSKRTAMISNPSGTTTSIRRRAASSFPIDHLHWTQCAPKRGYPKPARDHSA